MFMLGQKERIRDINIEDEMRVSYINYAMSVIVSRALPDVRDGLKPVHRRVIYAMRDMGLTAGKSYKKCAGVVGRTMEKFHPHGDGPIYDTLVRMAQEFSCRYPLVDGQGNFGSIDGDPPAAMRYTEARMTKLTEAMLADIEKNTVDFMPNYDGSESEPTVLPAAIPNLLINGSSGIAVGMATNIPPHNLGETIDAIIAYIDNPKITVKEILKYLPGPDFPTGGYICGRQGILSAYQTGRGKLTIRATAATEQKGKKTNIIINEIPYMVNKTKLLEEIANLVKNKKIEGISDLRDESDRDGMRIVIELKRDEEHEVILNQLYKHTSMQNTFGIILLALVDGRPKYLSIIEVIKGFVDHRREVIIRRTTYELEQAEKRAHILEGLRVALNHIDEIIQIIKASNNADMAKRNLMQRFDFSQIQAQAILDMRLHRLTGLERDKIDQEYDALLQAIDEYRGILEDPKKVMKVVRKELLEIQKKFADERRTKIIDAVSDFDIEDLIAEENMVITVSHAGYIKRITTSTYRRQLRGGRGISAAKTKDEDFIEHLFVASTHSYILFFTNQGRAHWLKVYAIPQAGRMSKGKAIINLLELEPEEKITAMIPVKEFDTEHNLIMATRKGIIKKTSLDAFSHPSKRGIIAIKLDEGDELIDVQMTDGSNAVVLATKNGKAVHFSESKVRTMGRATRGVKGINLKGNDEVIGMVIPRPEANLLTVTENGYGKRTPIEDYRLTNRGAQGVINIRNSKRNGDVVAISEVTDDDEFMIITKHGVAIRQAIKGIRAISRNTQGVRLIRLDEEDKVMALAKIAEKEDDETEGLDDEDSLNNEDEYGEEDNIVTDEENK